jgi:hypothetical protein
MRALSTYEKEYVAILLAIEQWRPYLHFQEFCIATDHKSMPYLNGVHQVAGAHIQDCI